VYAGIRQILRARRGLPHLHATTKAEPLPTSVAGVLGVLRRHPVGVMVGLYNMTEQDRYVPAWWLREQGLDPYAAQDHIRGAALEVTEHDDLELRAYQAMWLTRGD
ncbi:MAG: alpha-amylase, partial [Ornithinimicrobium sp.]